MDRIALIGNFPPRKCGIATFMNDLNDGIRSHGISTSIVAMNDGVKKYDYSADVEYEIEQNEITGYIKAAKHINNSNFDAVILQHEFGIFGGKDGINILQLIKRLKLPLVTTLHTILDNPSYGQRVVFNEIAHLSQKIISISQKGIDILHDTYNIPYSKCEHIPHGVHETRIKDITRIKNTFGLNNKRILLTFGLLSRNKSIEIVINALPDIVKHYPDTVYVILGATHPHVIRHEGEKYRQSLVDLVKELKLQENVLFIDRFVSNDELFEFLKMCDIYIIPYLGEKQISSGTLIYAMGAGKPVVSTPFWYAQEMLADGRGLLFDFNDSRQLSKKILYLLDNESERKSISRNAFELAEKCYWPKIGKQYIELLDSFQPMQINTTDYQTASEDKSSLYVPPLKLNHVKVLTDHTGILQHARYSIPNRTYGYCIDDNARALILMVMLQDVNEDQNEIDRLTNIYLSFIDYAYNPATGKFRNFMSYDRQWLEEEGSEDSAGRTMWALGYTVSSTISDNFYHHSNHLFEQGLENIDYICHPRALSYLLLGLVNYAKANEKENVYNLIKKKARQLSAYFDANRENEWIWFDNLITYGNCRIPEALMASGLYLNDKKMKERGLGLLDWLIEKQFENDMFCPIGNNGWMTTESKACFDQQPLEVHGMIDACLQAEEYTNNRKYADFALKAFTWFTGNNVAASIIYDSITGGSCDGLHCDGVNMNQGAESTLSWLLSLSRIKKYLAIHSKTITI